MAADFKDLKIGVIGATGLVGTTLAEMLLAQGARPLLYASVDSVGREVAGLSVKDAAKASADGLELRAAGAVCVDKSTAFRLEPDVPLIVPEVNAALARGQRLLANPNCVVIPLAVVLEPLRQQSPLTRVRLATYQSLRRRP